MTAPDLQPDTPSAVDFLKHLTPNDRWDLAAIPPDGGKPQFRTFFPDQHGRAFDWIEQRQGKAGLYHHVNRLRASVSSGMLDRYEQEFDSYRRHLHIWASGLPKILSKPGVMRPIDIEIANEGDRAADKVHLEATLSGPFHFLAIDHFDVALEDLLDVPDVPKPYLTPYFGDGPNLGTPRVDAFYPLDEPDDGAELSRRISWRCEELRQGARFTLPCIVVAEKGDAQGALMVTARGALQAKALTLTAPLKVSALPHPGPFANYLLAHLALVPLHYRRALAAELSITDRPCTCDDPQA